MSVKIEISKRVRDSGADLDQVEQQLAPAICKALGEAIKARVQGRGDLAGQTFPGWDDVAEGDDGVRRGRKKFVSARYPDKALGRVGKSGAEMFESSADYHRQNGTRPGTYSTTGGMWSGLSVVVVTPTIARLQFRGRSDGQDARFRAGKSKPIKEDNALKAWTVFAKHGVNVLALSGAELVGIGRGVVEAIASGISVTLPVTWEGQEPPTGDLAAILGAAINGR